MGSPVHRQPPFLRPMFWAMFGTALAAAGIGLITGGPFALKLGLANAALYALMIWLLPRVPTTVVGFISLAALLATAAFAMWVGDGINDVAVLFLPVTIIVGALLLEQVHFAILCALVVGVSATVGWGDHQGWLPNDTQPTQQLVDVCLYPVVLSGLSLIGALFVRSLSVSLERLEVSRRDYREIFDAVGDGIIVHDVEGNLVDVNQGALNMTGYSRADVPSLKIEVISGGHPGSGKTEAVERVKRAVTEGPQLFESRGRRRDGTEFYTEITLRNSNIGGEPRVLAVVRDISERKKLHEQVRQAETLQAVGQLAGGVAHDFNNQLAGISGYAEMIRLKYGQQCELVEYSDAILVATERARDLTDKLLAFARRGKHVSTLVDMRFLVREVASMLEHSIDPRISIQVNTAETAATVLGDPTPLQSALLNLGLNARDAMPDGGVLRFVVDVVAGVEEGLEVAQAVRIRVSDTGSGMSIEHQARAFEPFFTTKPSGTGMGLAAVYGTVQAHRGTVAVESVVEGGTTFTMKLPLQEVELESPRGDAAVSPSGVDQERLPLRVLVADDELGVRDVVRSFLEILGAEVTAVEDGDQAIAAARAGTFDVVVLDMAMPKLSGEEAFAALHRLDPDLPVVLMSGYVAEGKVAKLLEQGARAFLRKPFSMEALVKAVRSAAGSN